MTSLCVCDQQDSSLSVALSGGNIAFTISPRGWLDLGKAHGHKVTWFSGIEALPPQIWPDASIEEVEARKEYVIDETEADKEEL